MSWSSFSACLPPSIVEIIITHLTPLNVPGKPSGRMSDIRLNETPRARGRVQVGVEAEAANASLTTFVHDNYYQARQAFPFLALLIRRVVHRNIRNHVCKSTEKQIDYQNAQNT